MPRPPALRPQFMNPNNKAATRRTVLKAGSTLLLSLIAPGLSYAAQIVAVRVWPSDEYTRVTLENDSDLKATHFLVQNPNRLVIDIEGLELNPTLKELIAKIQSNDPFISQVRVGQNRPNVVRLVFDLKAEIRPQVFTLAPVGEYKYRLVFDLYPTREYDPIAALIESGERPADRPFDYPTANIETLPQINPEPPLAKIEPKPERRNNAPDMKRMITIAIDPGHGGEDPGAVGRSGSYEKNIVLAIAKRLKAKIEQQPNMRVMLTRDGDYFVPLH
ncbi:MAG: N-acetylmuramoyl-L-alanine amidase, partial [bacterium]